MNAQNITDKIKWYWHYQKTLSYLLLANLAAFIYFKESFFTLFFFVFLLFFAGSLFLERLPQVRLLWAYAGGAAAGAFLFYLWEGNHDYFARSNLIVSAMQAGIFSVLTTITLYNPGFKMRLFIIANIQIKYLTAVIVILNLLSIDNPAIYLAHAGGCLCGVVYGLLLNGKASKLFKSKSAKKPKMKAEYNPERPLSDDEYSAIKVEKQKKIDKILDKISKSGYESLTKEEKELLFKSGND